MTNFLLLAILVLRIEQHYKKKKCFDIKKYNLIQYYHHALTVYVFFMDLIVG